MGYEIERKFLLLNEGWRPAVIAVDTFRDGLLLRSRSGKVRVRQGLQKAWITVKGARHGIRRPEFEYEIPISDAVEMIETLCGPAIQKTRHTVIYADLAWSVDIHHGVLAGIEFAEVELADPRQCVEFPEWIGEEITHDVRFRKETLLRRCVEEAALPMS
jgi:adenylate cyclase